MDLNQVVSVYEGKQIFHKPRVAPSPDAETRLLVGPPPRANTSSSYSVGVEDYHTISEVHSYVYIPSHLFVHGTIYKLRPPTLYFIQF